MHRGEDDGVGENVTIDRERCQGHGRCALIAPDLFDMDDLGIGVLLTEPVPAEGVDEAREAALSCPEGAITLGGGS